MHRFLISLFAVLYWVVPGICATWEIDGSHAAIRFKVRHLMVSNVSGEFSGIKGVFEIDEKDITKLKTKATLNAETINTNNAKRDEHLRTADFLDVAKYPTISFTSNKVTGSMGSPFKIMGNLTLHGVTKEIVLNAEPLLPAIKDPWGKTRRGFSATSQVNRKDFGIIWNKAMETGGVVVGDEVKIDVEFELVAVEPSTKS